MFMLFIDCLYNCCFCVKKKQAKRQKIHEAVEQIEKLTHEEFSKQMIFFLIINAVSKISYLIIWLLR